MQLMDESGQKIKQPNLPRVVDDHFDMHDQVSILMLSLNRQFVLCIANFTSHFTCTNWSNLSIRNDSHKHLLHRLAMLQHTKYVHILYAYKRLKNCVEKVNVG